MPENTSQTTGSQCPSCGIMVAAGYPKCPKCHANMPKAAPSKPSYTRGAPASGGTALEPSSAMAWIAGVAALLLVGGGTIYFLARGDGAKNRLGTSAAPAPPRAAAAEPRARSRALLPTSTDASVAGGGEPLADRRAAATTALRDQLSAGRLWSDVENVADDTSAVVLRTAYCADPKLRAVVDKLAPQLRAAKLTTLRCEARHGALVFELTP